LPTLMAKFEPSMRMSSISVFTETIVDGLSLESLQMQLSDSKSDEKLINLVKYGHESADSLMNKEEFSKNIDRITIISNPEGICNVIVNNGENGSHKIKMVSDAKTCEPG